MDNTWTPCNSWKLDELHRAREPHTPPSGAAPGAGSALRGAPIRTSRAAPAPHTIKNQSHPAQSTPLKRAGPEHTTTPAGTAFSRINHLRPAPPEPDEAAPHPPPVPSPTWRWRGARPSALPAGQPGPPASPAAAEGRRRRSWCGGPGAGLPEARRAAAAPSPLPRAPRPRPRRCLPA